MSLYTVKAPDGGHIERMLAYGEIWPSDGQDGMSMQRNSAKCEYWRRLCDARSNRHEYLICKNGRSVIADGRNGGRDIGGFIGRGVF